MNRLQVDRDGDVCRISLSLTPEAWSLKSALMSAEHCPQARVGGGVVFNFNYSDLINRPSPGDPDRDAWVVFIESCPA